MKELAEIPVTRGPQLRAAPPAAAARRLLRDGLPAVYLDGDFTMRFLGSLEEQLDPIVATLDSLVGLISPETAPAHVLRLEAAWLGLVVDEGLPAGVCRELIRNAAELTRRRGTAGGLALLLSITFPELRLEVEDGGCVTFAGGPPASSDVHRFRVLARGGITADQRSQVTAVIERERPAHVSYELVGPA